MVNEHIEIHKTITKNNKIRRSMTILSYGF